MTENVDIAQVLEAFESGGAVPDAAARWIEVGGPSLRAAVRGMVGQAARGAEGRTPVQSLDETVALLAASAGQQYDVNSAAIVGTFESIINGTATPAATTVAEEAAHAFFTPGGGHGGGGGGDSGVYAAAGSLIGAALGGPAGAGMGALIGLLVARIARMLAETEE